MTCDGCVKPITNAIYYETHRLCQPCYEVWVKADEDALVAEGLGK